MHTHTHILTQDRMVSPRISEAARGADDTSASALTFTNSFQTAQTPNPEQINRYRPVTK